MATGSWRAEAGLPEWKRGVVAAARDRRSFRSIEGVAAWHSSKLQSSMLFPTIGAKSSSFPVVVNSDCPWTISRTLSDESQGQTPARPNGLNEMRSECRQPGHCVGVGHPGQRRCGDHGIGTAGFSDAGYDHLLVHRQLGRPAGVLVLMGGTFGSHRHCVCGAVPHILGNGRAGRSQVDEGSVRPDLLQVWNRRTYYQSPVAR